jgi:CRISPR-associated endonuclease/helicase Cas3
MKQLLAHKDHPLISHLREVAKLSAEFAAAFDASEQGRLAGFLHDLGKAEAEFQERIVSEDKDEGKKKPHAHHGAAYALRACLVNRYAYESGDHTPVSPDRNSMSSG